MGMYDTYGSIQLKVGNVDMRNYKVGDKVEIRDGVYIGYGGLIVIKDGKFIVEFPHLIDKWGNIIDCREVFEKNSPVVKAIKQIEKKYKRGGTK